MSQVNIRTNSDIEEHGLGLRDRKVTDEVWCFKKEKNADRQRLGITTQELILGGVTVFHIGTKTLGGGTNHRLEQHEAATGGGGGNKEEGPGGRSGSSRTKRADNVDNQRSEIWSRFHRAGVGGPGRLAASPILQRKGRRRERAPTCKVSGGRLVLRREKVKRELVKEHGEENRSVRRKRKKSGGCSQMSFGVKKMVLGVRKKTHR